MEGHLKRYRFSDNGATATVSVSGGVLVTYSLTKLCGEPKLTIKQAMAKGQEMLKKMGYDHFIETYYTLDGGTAVINYAYMQDGIIYYTDLVKMAIALDTGEMMQWDATGYIMNHTTRRIPAIKITEEKARGVISPNLKIGGQARLALIPNDGGLEQLCYEYRCTGTEGENVLVYINTETGWEEEVLILLEDETGVLVM